jgi:dihydroneopterin aldolase
LLNSNLVRVCIDELLVDAYLGVHASEQKKRKKIPVYLEYEYEQPAGDSLALAVDYRKVRDTVFGAIKDRRFHLVETMARTILDALKTEPRICRVSVRVGKMKALRQARSVMAVVEWDANKE